MHSVWNPQRHPYRQGRRALRPDVVRGPWRMDNLDALAEFKVATHVPTTASETLSTRYAFRELLENRAVSIVMFDCGWVEACPRRKRSPPWPSPTTSRWPRTTVLGRSPTSPTCTWISPSPTVPGDGAGLHPWLVRPAGHPVSRGYVYPLKGRDWVRPSSRCSPVRTPSSSALSCKGVISLSRRGHGGASASHATGASPFPARRGSSRRRRATPPLRNSTAPAPSPVRRSDASSCMWGS